MASQALYRRYRSQTFDELIGQEHIVQTLRNAIADGRIAHAYLFTGPRGVGKTTVARLLAKAVNCTAPADQRPCGVCEMCQAVAEGSAVDVIEMDAASHTSVEDAREIIERVQFRPAIGTYKVYIIDESHMLSTAAFNALLKTLEEPPGHALFILATTEVHKVPATILSRCQRFTFNRHSITSTAEHLRAVAEQEQFTLESGAAEAIARAATGSMRDALSVLDQLMSYGSSTITLEQVRGLLGATDSQEVAALVDAMIAGDVAAGLRSIAAVAQRGADLRQFTRDLVERLRALMLLNASGDPSLLDVSDDELAVLQQQTSSADLGSLLAWTRLFGELDHQLRTSPYGQLPLEMAVVEAIAAPSQTQTIERKPQAARPAARPAVEGPRPKTQDRPAARPAVEDPRPKTQDRPATQPMTDERIEPARPTVEDPGPRTQDLPAVQAGVSQQPAPGSVQPTADDPQSVTEGTPRTITEDRPSTTDDAPRSTEYGIRNTGDIQAFEGVAAANADAATLEHIESIWPEIIRDVRVFDKTLQALLNSGVKPVDVKEKTIILEVANDWLLGRLEKPNLRQIVEKVISRQMGSAYTISCVVETQRREDPNVLREQIRNSRKDPLVKAAMNIFDAEIIRVETDEE